MHAGVFQQSVAVPATQVVEALLLVGVPVILPVACIQLFVEAQGIMQAIGMISLGVDTSTRLTAIAVDSCPALRQFVEVMKTPQSTLDLL